MAIIVPTVESIGDEALTNSIIDRSITEIQDSLTEKIGRYAFYRCEALTKAVFGSVTQFINVDEYSSPFLACRALKTLDFHSTVNFPKYAFDHCSAIEALILRSKTMCTLGANVKSVFESSNISNGMGYIYVPADLVETYKADANWSACADQIRAIEDYPEVCDLYSWAAVAKNIEDGTYKSVYKIGDTVPVNMGGQGTINMQIVAFDVDTLADGSGKAAISWIGKELLKTTKRMNPARTGTSGAYNEGTGTIGGWEKSELRAYLNNTIKPLIPADVASMIRSVKKTHDSYNTAGSKVTQTVEEEVWIPAYGGELSNGGIYNSWFQDKTNTIKCAAGSSSVLQWWTRSANGSSFFWRINTTGLGTASGAVTNTIGVPLCFCTGKSK